MSTAANAASLQGLKRRALSLGAVKVFDHALQFLLPVVLVRCLDAASFGEYRLLWLAVGTVMAVATLNMSGSLYYFLPRSEPRRKRLYVHQTMLYLAAAGLVCAFLVSPWNPLMPAPLEPLERHGWVVPAFVALWVLTFMLDQLPSVDERIRWQAGEMLTLSALRVVLVAARRVADGRPARGGLAAARARPRPGGAPGLLRAALPWTGRPLVRARGLRRPVPACRAHRAGQLAQCAALARRTSGSRRACSP